MKQSGFVLAIDGPAGSGKSTTARRCARELGFRYLDTGAMYRAVALKVIETATDLRSSRVLGRLLRSTRVGFRWRPAGPRVMLDGRDVTDAVRLPRVSARVSEVSAIPAVRRAMVREQRRLARGQDVVCEGRDIGSVVFPDADLKVYLDCGAAERALRRRRELVGKRIRASVRSVAANLRKRDRIDSSRRMAPLRRLADAVLVDTSMLTIDEQVAVVCSLARQRLARQGTGA